MTDSLKSQKRQFWIILVIIFTGFIGISIPYLIFPPLFLNPEYSFLPVSSENSSRALFLGVTLAAYPLGQFIGSPILGSLSDDYGRKHLITSSLFVACICNLMSGIAIAKQHLSLLIASRFVAGLMEGNVAIARAMCADLKNISKHETFGKVNAASSIAYLLGPLLGGVMTDEKIFPWFTVSTPFYFVCALFLILSIISIIALQNVKRSVSNQKRTFIERVNLIARLSALFTNQKLKYLLLSSTCFTLAVDIFYEFGPVYLTLKWMLSPIEQVPYNALLCFGLAVGNGWLAVFISSRFQIPKIVKGAMCVFSFLLLGIVFANTQFVMFLWFALSGIVIGIAVILITVQISDTASDQIQGEVMGTQLSLRVLGDGLICLFGSTLLILSSKIILIIAAILPFAAIYFFNKSVK